MSEFAKTAAMMVIGGVVGVGGFAFLTNEKEAEAAAPLPAATASADAKPTPPLEPAEEPEPTSTLSVQAMVTGGIERNRPGAAFAVFDIASGADVTDVQLVITGAPGTRPQEAVGAGFERSGDRLTVDVGDLAGKERKQVVVALKLSHDAGDFTYHTTHQSLHGERETVRSTSVDRNVARKYLNHDAYKLVREQYNEDTLEIAQHLRDSGDYEEALGWVEDAYQANLDVGMAVRLTGELAPYQKELKSLEDELRELMKPKAKVRRKAPPKREIEVYRLDKRNWR